MRIDFHTHLLPAVDDGSRSVAESLDMLKALRDQNVHCAIATPHFYSNKTGLTEFLHQRDAAYEKLQSERTDAEPKLLLGAEVAFFRGIGRAEGIEQLCITGTNVMLIEMPFVRWGNNEVSEFNHILDRGIVPVLAHVERYYPFQRDMSALNEIINLPVYLQVNAESLEIRRARKFIFRLIENGFLPLLGTDCHNMRSRKPDINAGRDVLAKTFGDGYLEAMDALGTDLLNFGNVRA
jgi:protein-tyrosine phosphatase